MGESEHRQAAYENGAYRPRGYRKPIAPKPVAKRIDPTTMFPDGTPRPRRSLAEMLGLAKQETPAVMEPMHIVIEDRPQARELPKITAPAIPTAIPEAKPKAETGKKAPKPVAKKDLSADLFGPTK